MRPARLKSAFRNFLLALLALAATACGPEPELAFEVLRLVPVEQLAQRWWYRVTAQDDLTEAYFSWGPDSIELRDKHKDDLIAQVTVDDYLDIVRYYNPPPGSHPTAFD